LVKSKFVDAIQNYQTVEQQYRQKYKQRMERQFKIGALLFLSDDPGPDAGIQLNRMLRPRK